MIGRPPVEREKVLACLKRLRRASVARISEETGCKTHTIQYVLRKSHHAGEIARQKETSGDYRPFYIYEVK